MFGIGTDQFPLPIVISVEKLFDVYRPESSSKSLCTFDMLQDI